MLFVKVFLTSLMMLMVLNGCGPHSQEDFREEGEGLTRTLIQELKSIHTREKLLASTSTLQYLFERLVTIMIAAREFSHSHLEQDKCPLTAYHHDLSDQLLIELNRIYQIEGARQIIEKCQEKALHRLDAFEKRLLKQNETNRAKR